MLDRSASTSLPSNSSSTRPRRVLRAFVWAGMGLAALSASGCTSCSEKIPIDETPEEKIDVEADRVAARNSWLIKLAKDPKPLSDLADSGPGWGPFFGSQTEDAMQAFTGDALPPRIGRARAALELAEAHANLTGLVKRLTPDLLAAQQTRPGAEGGAAWRAFMNARATGDFSKVPKDGAVGALAAAAASTETPLGKLLAGDPAGAGAEMPAEATSTWGMRLSIAALARAGQVDKALRRAKRLKHRSPDFKVTVGAETFSFRDPGAANAMTLLYAAIAEQAVRDLPGWPSLLRARALMLLGRDAEAITILEALTKAMPAEPPTLAQLVIGDALDVDDLLTEVWARLAVAAARTKNAAQVEAAAAALAQRQRTVSDRVWHAWVKAQNGEPVAEGVFPLDRRELLVPLRNEIEALGKAAKGAVDVSQLLLVDRYVDRLQRRFAAALIAGDKLALGVKMREAAEEKTANLAPSARNTVSSLAATARDNMQIGRPRVALKYLSRLADALPDAHGPAEMLRDLLSLRAMEQGGSATAGH